MGRDDGTHVCDEFVVMPNHVRNFVHKPHRRGDPAGRPRHGTASREHQKSIPCVDWAIWRPTGSLPTNDEFERRVEGLQKFLPE